MTVAPGYIFDLELSGAAADAGPWSSGRHPRLIVAVGESAATLVPLTTAAPRGNDRGFGYEITNGGDVLSTPIWAHCQHVTTIGLERLRRLTTRGRIPTDELAPIRSRLGRYLRIAP